MKKVKSRMESFFAAIFCFLMNLIPGKKVWAVVNELFENTVNVNYKNRKTAGQVNQNNANCVSYEGNAGTMCLDARKCYKNDYIRYLYEEINSLNYSRKSIEDEKQIVSGDSYEDTG